MNPGGPKTIEYINSLLEETIIFVGIYNLQFEGTLILMVFELRGFAILKRPGFSHVFFFVTAQGDISNLK